MYRLVYKISYGCAGHYDSDYEYSNWYDTQDLAEQKGQLELQTNNSLYLRYCERYRNSYIEKKE